MLAARVNELYRLESLSDGDTAFHRFHAAPKLIVTFVYIAVVVSFHRADITGVVPYFLYPTLVMAIAEVPYGMLLRRFLIALPFCAFAGATNALLDRQTAFVLELGARDIAVSFGVLSLITIVLRTYLCVMAVFLLIATTPFATLTRQLRRMRVPGIFILLIEMIYRYIGVLIGEAATMSLAYSLRSVRKKNLEMRHMGSFVGQLALRSFDRGERVYAAMMCRGYGQEGLLLYNNQASPPSQASQSQPPSPAKSAEGRTIPGASLAAAAVLIAAFVALRVFPILHIL